MAVTLGLLLGQQNCVRTACCFVALAARWEEVRVRWSWSKVGSEE